MKQAISGAGIPPGIISIKAKTNEKRDLREGKKEYRFRRSAC